MINIQVNPKRELGKRDQMIYGHFIEHFHRQIYGGIYDPESKFADKDGFRTDIIEALKKIKVPVLRWPGGCFVSSYHWKDGVGKQRKPFFDKAWRVEDPNSFGTDEFIKLCRKLETEAYICTNAGTGTAEEMSDWVEYCNLKNEGYFAKWRIENGSKDPHRVKYWSIGNENYGDWEIGAKTAAEWGQLVKEAAKMMKHVDPEIELSAAALADIEWNLNLLKNCGQFLDWISIHQYWDMLTEENNLATYEEVIAYTDEVDQSVKKVRGLLEAFALDDKIKIAFDEWNLRSWHHPNVHTVKQGVEKKSFIDPRDKNDDNSQYTMADAIFTAVFLNAMNRNCDLVKMANFSPVLNSRGCIYSYPDGIVLRSTYHVFDLYVNYLGDTIIDLFAPEISTLKVRSKEGVEKELKKIDLLATKWSDKKGIAVSLINKDPVKSQKVQISFLDNFNLEEAVHYYICGENPDSYNDIERQEIKIRKKRIEVLNDKMIIDLKAHSVNILQLNC